MRTATELGRVVSVRYGACVGRPYGRRQLSNGELGRHAVQVLHRQLVPRAGARRVSAALLPHRPRPHVARHSTRRRLMPIAIDGDPLSTPRRSCSWRCREHDVVWLVFNTAQTVIISVAATNVNTQVRSHTGHSHADRHNQEDCVWGCMRAP